MESEVEAAVVQWGDMPDDDPNPPEQRKIFVGGLSWSTTEEKLQQYFQNFGVTVERLSIMRDKTTACSRGFGFVTFTTMEGLEMVCSQRHVLDGRKIECKKAIPKSEIETQMRRVFVGGIPLSLEENTLREYFETFGLVEECRIMTERLSNRSRGFAFVCFYDDDVMNAVLNSTHSIEGKFFEVKKARVKQQMTSVLTDPTTPPSLIPSPAPSATTTPALVPSPTPAPASPALPSTPILASSPILPFPVDFFSEERFVRQQPTLSSKAPLPERIELPEILLGEELGKSWTPPVVVTKQQASPETPTREQSTSPYYIPLAHNNYKQQSQGASPKGVREKQNSPRQQKDNNSQVRKNVDSKKENNQKFNSRDQSPNNRQKNRSNGAPASPSKSVRNQPVKQGHQGLTHAASAPLTRIVSNNTPQMNQSQSHPRPRSISDIASFSKQNSSQATSPVASGAGSASPLGSDRNPIAVSPPLDATRALVDAMFREFPLVHNNVDQSAKQNYLESELLLLYQGFPKPVSRRAEPSYVMRRDRFSAVGLEEEQHAKKPHHVTHDVADLDDPWAMPPTHYDLANS